MSTAQRAGGPPSARPGRLAVALAVALMVASAAVTPAGAAPRQAGAATTRPAQQGELSIADVAALARPSVVDVVVGDDTGGSGVSVGEGIVTSAHVVGDAKEVALVLPDGRRATATVVRADDGYDLALLRTDADVPALQMEASGAQRQGDTVLVLGFPALGDASLSRGATLTRGIISAVRTDEVSGATLIQTDAPIGDGASGGALLNLRGRLIGIPAFTLHGAPGLGFAVAGETVQAFLDGRPSRRPEPQNLATYLLPVAALGADYEGRVEPGNPRDREATAYADSPTGPAVVQLLSDAGTPERASESIAGQAAAAQRQGLTEIRMAVTGGKRVFARYDEEAQEMAVVAGKGPYVVTLFLDFAGLPDTGRRTELAIQLTDRLLARLPG